MDNPRRRLRRWLVSALVLTATSTTVALGSSAPAGATSANESALALQWYDITNQTVVAAGFPEPVTWSRTWAVSWLAAAHAVAPNADATFQHAAFSQALHDTLAA